MRVLTPERVPLWTAFLTALSLALVFGAAGGFLPSTAVPEPPEPVLSVIPTVNVAISALAFATIAYGWLQIRRGAVERHRRAMLLATGLFAAFLALYLTRLVAIGGATPFAGPDRLYHFVYLPVLFVHVTFAVVCIPLLYYVLLLATTHSVPELRRTRHATIGRVAAALWLISFALGIVVYLLVHVAY